jgi:hypothetical protein
MAPEWARLYPPRRLRDLLALFQTSGEMGVPRAKQDKIARRLDAVILACRAALNG